MRGSIAGEWILLNKGWRVVDPVYFDVMAIFDVSNAYGRFQQAELMDHDWSKPGNKRIDVAKWQSGYGPGKVVFSLQNGATWYGLFAVDESSGRAKLRMEWKQGSFPETISENAAVYVERDSVYLRLDAQRLGIID